MYNFKWRFCVQQNQPQLCTLNSALCTYQHPIGIVKTTKRRRDSNKERGDVIRLAFRTLCLCSAFCRNACASSSQYQTEKSTLGRDYIIHQNSTFVNSHFARYFTGNFVILNSMKKFRGQCHSNFCAFCCDLDSFYVEIAKKRQVFIL